MTGFDFSSEALKVARGLLPCSTFKTHDLYSTTEDRFDVLVCTEVLEHLLYPEMALRNILQLINPGASAILSVPNGREDTFQGHINFWSPESWKVFIIGIEGGFAAKTFNHKGSHNIAIIRTR